MGSLGRPPVREIGGKARTLVELQRAGFPVPDFLCSPSHLAHAVDCLGLPLAVRSSASVEDGREVSFAGQFETYLNLGTLEQVEHAVRKCKESVKAPSVAEYCRRSGINLSSLHMEVIVQRMVQPELAGVAFTVNPVTGAEEVVIEACEGLADNLLAGRTASLLRDHPGSVNGQTRIAPFSMDIASSKVCATRATPRTVPGDAPIPRRVPCGAHPLNVKWLPISPGALKLR